MYYLGIGGIGMSALARYFRAAGLPVAGYDKTPSALTEALSAEGCRIHFSDDTALLPAELLTDKAGSLVVYTPAIPADHSELNFLRDSGYRLMKRAQVLGLIAAGHYCVAVAGTHGKTTTSCLIAHLLRQAGRNVTAFLGGITQNYHTNLLLSEAPPRQTVLVAEADEFDRSFLALYPDMAVITAADPDHLDIYGTAETLRETFSAFADQVKPGGKLFMRQGLNLPVSGGAQVISYSLQAGDLYAGLVEIRPPHFHFRVFGNAEVTGQPGPDTLLAEADMQVPGFHNAENAVAAIGVAQALGLSKAEIEAGLASFAGVKRRFEYVVRRSDCIYIDDYAHHPAEIAAFLGSVKALYPGKRLVCIFQPHLFSRTSDFMEGFAESLAIADELILMDIYPAREWPLPGITSAVLLEKVQLEHKSLKNSDEILNYLKLLKPELLVTVGAGDIDRISNLVKVLLEV